ncbi:hypothetical protein GAY28_01010 [Azospirillum brasilense]|nr:hypothetical protein [Azospirillum brasilense]
MAESLSTARACAILEIQKIRQLHSVNSFEHAVADHAIDLVLNETRPEDTFLVMNALQDAKSVLSRRKRRDALRYGDLALLDNLDGATVASPSARLAVSPEATLYVAQRYGAIKAWAHQRSARSVAVLDDWRNGLTGAESSHQRHVSERTIDAERQALRLAARQLCAEAVL